MQPNLGKSTGQTGIQSCHVLLTGKNSSKLVSTIACLTHMAIVMALCMSMQGQGIAIP